MTLAQFSRSLGSLLFALTLAAQAHGQAMPMEHHESKPAVLSTSLTVIANGKSVTFTPADLAAMPQRTLLVHNGHNQQDETYTGVGLSDLLAKYGLTLDAPNAAKVYHSYIRAEGTDKYFVLYSASELEPELHTWDSIVALTVNGHSLGIGGAFELVSGGERKPARWVKNLTTVTIVTIP